jgi:hypothetical protein
MQQFSRPPEGAAVSEEEPWQRLLLDALAVLALPSDEQVRVNGPGCVACDLRNDFDHARMIALGNAPGLSEEQRRLLERIDALMRGMQQPDFECFNDKVVRRPVWQELRELAAEALRAFGWERVVVRPFMEIQPGVWHKPHAEAEQGAAANGPRE